MIDIYVDSYKIVMQNSSGGIPMRINKMKLISSSRNDINFHLFNQWTDKIVDCDILHIFKVSIDSYNLALMAKKNNKKIVLSSVIPIDKSMNIKLANFVYKFFPVLNTYTIYKKMLLIADVVIAQTSKEKKHIVRNYNISPNKIIVIPNGVEESILCREFDEKQVRDIVLCVGRFDENKNQMSLIKALKDTNIPLYFVGGPSLDFDIYYERCLKQARQNKNIHFIGWLEHNSEELMNLFNRSKVVALVSYKEIFGNSIIEGAASGANLVITNVLPVEDWQFDKDHYALIKAKSIKSIRKAVIEMYNCELSNQTKEVVKKKFDWNNVFNEYAKIYKALMGEREK